MHWMSSDSKLMQAWGELVDGVLINLLMLVTSMPLVTLGAALTAGHDAARRSVSGEGRGAAANYIKSFKANFVASTLLWLPFAAGLAVLAYAWLALRITPLLVPKFALTIVWVIGFEWVFALEARFKNTVRGTLGNAFIFGVSHIGTTLALAAVDAVFIGLVAASWLIMPQGLFLLAACGYGTVLMLHVPLTERVFAPHLHAAPALSEDGVHLGMPPRGAMSPNSPRAGMQQG